MTEVKDAVKNLKTIGSELTIWENRLEVAKGELQRTQQARDALQAEIDKKTADFQIYMSQRDADNKKVHSDIVAEREKLEKDKADFQNILKGFQNDRNSLTQAQRDLDIQKLRHAQTEKNVQEFITAVRRACGLLGL
jgi:DNA repair exonuclease SbcCD ATPase subunit